MSLIYAVHIGRTPGIYTTWDDCHAQIYEFPDAKYKTFLNIKSARHFVKTGEMLKPDKKKTPQDDYEEYHIPSEWVIDESQEPLTLYVKGCVKVDINGIPRGEYEIWFGFDDPRNLNEPFKMPRHTSQRCEIMGARRAIEVINERKYIEKTTELIIATDSLYLINEMKNSNKWKKNQGLLKSLHLMAQTRAVTFQKIN